MKTKKSPRRIAFANFKGGTGKTTTAAAFATALAEAGNKVLFVDTDTQALVRPALGALDSPYGLSDLANGEDFETVVYRFTDRADSVLPRKNLDVITSKGELEKLSTKQLGLAWTLSDEDREGQFSEVMEEVEAQTDYDFILIDTSPTDGIINTNVFFYVHEIFVPIALNNFSVVGFTDFLDIIEKTQKKKSKRKDAELQISYILPTKRDLRKRTSGSLLEQIQKIARQRVPDAIVLEPIPECSKTEECSIFRKSIVEYEPNSRGGLAYLKAIKGVLNGKHKRIKRAG